MTAPVRIVTVADEPDLIERIETMADSVWPRFVRHGVLSIDDHQEDAWGSLYRQFPDYQFAVLDDANGELLASGNCVPLDWSGPREELPDTGWEWAITRAYADQRRQATANAVVALAIAVHPTARSRGLGPLMIQHYRAHSKSRGLRLFAPVRPSHKSRYPITPFADFLAWRDDSGETFDPWLRSHLRAGATIIKPCLQSMVFRGTVSQWEDWVEMKFPQTGEYVVPGMLVPLRIDRTEDMGEYAEPNVWVEHLH